jgi:hypothetical protein
MTRRLVVHPHARSELADASDWDDERDKRLGDELLRTFERAINSIVQNPFQYQTVSRKARRANLGKFPYGLIYTVTDDEMLSFHVFMGDGILNAGKVG